MTASWADSFPHALEANDVRLVSYVPDNVLTPLIAGAVVKVLNRAELTKRLVARLTRDEAVVAWEPGAAARWIRSACSAMATDAMCARPEPVMQQGCETLRQRGHL
jgi:hypothetical protein